MNLSKHQQDLLNYYMANNQINYPFLLVDENNEFYPLTRQMTKKLLSDGLSYRRYKFDNKQIWVFRSPTTKEERK